MRKLIVLAVVAMFLVVSSSFCFAAGSDVQNSTIVNATKNTGLNAAIGENATANQGSLNIKDSKVKNSTIVNASTNTGLNAAIGKGAEANQGSVNIK